MPPSPAEKAVVLLSGGLDSATTLAIAQQQRSRVYAISFQYGQRHRLEIDAAAKLARVMRVCQHLVMDIDLGQFGGSALTSELRVPKRDHANDIGGGIPITYVPARNTVFLSLALAWSEVLGTGNIYIGVNALDYSGYPDCRPEYIRAFERMANLATKGAVEGTLPVCIHAPLLHLTKAQIIRRGMELGVDYSLTSSCYDPSPKGIACGHCDACLLRLRGFAENGQTDPGEYSR